MTDNEKIQSFADMVEATEKLSNPWQEECKRKDEIITKKDELIHKMAKAFVIAIIMIVMIFSITICFFLHLAYTDTVEFEQGQNFEEQTQSQSYSEW